MKTRIEDLVDAAEASVPHYELCRSCLSKVEITGKGRAPEKEVYRVV